MKKILSLLLVATMILSVGAITVSAENTQISDEFLNAVRYEYDNYSIEKDDIYVEKMLSFEKERFVVQYSVEGCAYTDDMCVMGLSKYILESSRPEPVLYYYGKLYDLEYACDNHILSDRELLAMYESGLFDMEKTKIHLDLLDAMGASNSDKYINVRFEVVGYDKYIGDIENWMDDIAAAGEKLEAHYEEIHQKLINEVLKDIDHIDRVHNNGISVVALKKDDIKKVSENDFVLFMEYVSDIHMKYIETYKQGFKNYRFKELKTQYNSDYTPQYTIVNAHSLTGASAEIWFRIGNSVVYSGSIYSDFRYGYGIYDYAQDKFLDVYEVKDTPEVYDNLEENLLSCNAARPVADTDGDRRVTVMDATNIQRFLAKLDHDYIRYYCGDMDNDGKLSLIDATMIQKLVAKV